MAKYYYEYTPPNLFILFNFTISQSSVVSCLCKTSKMKMDYPVHVFFSFMAGTSKISQKHGQKMQRHGLTWTASHQIQIEFIFT